MQSFRETDLWVANSPIWCPDKGHPAGQSGSDVSRDPKISYTTQGTKKTTISSELIWLQIIYLTRQVSLSRCICSNVIQKHFFIVMVVYQCICGIPNKIIYSTLDWIVNQSGVLLGQSLACKWNIDSQIACVGIQPPQNDSSTCDKPILVWLTINCPPTSSRQKRRLLQLMWLISSKLFQRRAKGWINIHLPSLTSPWSLRRMLAP